MRINVPQQDMHTWATLVLPYMEQKNVYDRYHFDKKWDHADNQPAVSNTISNYVCPSAPHRGTLQGTQHYGVVDYSPIFALNAVLDTNLLDPWSGDVRGAMSSNPNGTPILSITDGTSSTILIAEVAGRPQLWIKGRQQGNLNFPIGWATSGGYNPIDLDGASEDGTSLPGPCAINCTNVHEVYGFHFSGANMTFADGSVHFLDESISIRTMAALVTKSGGEVVSEDLY